MPDIRIKTVFGKEIDLASFGDVDVREALSPVDQLTLENKDPNYVYGWLDTRDPTTQFKIRKGLWEPVKAEEGGVTVPYKTDEADGNIHVRELIAVRMEKDLYDRIQKAYVVKALMRSAAVQDQFRERAKAITSEVSPGSDPGVTIGTHETVKEESRPFAAGSSWGAKTKKSTESPENSTK